jgi:hypothetical protein
MGQVVLDGSNLEAIIKDATGEGFQIPGPSIAHKGTDGEKANGSTDHQSGTQKARDNGADADVSKTGAEGSESNAQGVEADDIEGEDGLTPRQKRELTAKMQSAIGKKHRQAREAEEFATEQYNTRRLAEERAEELAKENARLKAKVEPPAKEPTKPERQNFASEDEYRDALIDFQVDQRLKAQAEKDAKIAQEKRQAEIVANASARIAKAQELVPDFTEVTEAVDTEVPPAIANYMQESEMFAELGYHLAKHPEELERIRGLHWTRQLVEIGKIESKLQPFAASAEKVKSEDAAKASTNGAKPSTETGENPSPRSAPVIRPLSSSSATQVDKPEREMTAAEALAAWQKKKHINLTRRSRH